MWTDENGTFQQSIHLGMVSCESFKMAHGRMTFLSLLLEFFET